MKIMTKNNEEMTPYLFIKKAIHQAFEDLAEAVGDSDFEGLSEDEIASIPYILSSAENQLLAAWFDITHKKGK